MIAAWMVYGILVGSIVGAAGLAVEYSLRALRRPIRFVWVCAMVVAVFLPVVLPLASTRGVQSDAGTRAPLAETAVSQPDAPRPTVELPFQAPRSFGVPSRLSALNVPLLAIWVGLSMLWAGALLISATRLRRQSAAWKEAMLDGTPIYVSHDVGPALFGISRFSIVLPAWTLSLDERRRQLLLDHEREHARTADPVLLMTGALLVMLQPWNPVAWLMFHRLRFALELDCDARVLARTPDVRAYGELLLEVGGRSLAGAAPIAAFSEPYTLLNRRITMMTARAPRRPLLRGLAALTAAGLLVVAACQVPRPVPGSGAGAVAATPVTGLVNRSTAPNRAIVHLTSVGLHNAGERPTILIYGVGSAQIGIGGEALMPLRDTLRLSHLPAMIVDVTEADVHFRLLGSGEVSFGGQVTGGPTNHLSASGTHLVLLKGGRGVQTNPSTP